MCSTPWRFAQRVSYSAAQTFSNIMNRGYADTPICLAESSHGHRFF